MPALLRCILRLEVERLAGHCLVPGSTVVSDGLDCFTAVTAAGCVDQPIRTGSGRKSAAHPRSRASHGTASERPRRPYHLLKFAEDHA